MKAELLFSLLLVWLILGCRGPAGQDGHNGQNGQSIQGPPGVSGSIPFSYTGSANFPIETATQIIPNLNLENGSVIDVYISWQNQPWTQIGSTWVGGMAGSYAVVNNVVTITVVIGPTAPQWQWAITGINKS